MVKSEKTNAALCVGEMMLEKETPGTYVYGDNRPTAPMPKVYIRKFAFGDMKPPVTLTIMVQR